MGSWGRSAQLPTARTLVKRGNNVATSVFEKLKAMVVEQLGVEEKDVVPTASFVEDLGAQLFLD